MKRFLSALMTLVLALTLTAPALAAGPDGGENRGSFYSGQGPGGRYIIRERAGDDSACGLAVSADGRTWRPIGRRMTPDMMRLEETGGAVIYYCFYSGELWYWDGADWAQASMPGIGTSMTVDYDACWTGDGYLVVQSATGGGMMGWNQDAAGAYNNSVLVTDGQFQLVAEHDFGGPVTGLSCADGVCYAQVLTGEAYVVYQSADRVNWTATALTALPEGAPQAPAGAKALAAGDQTDGALVYRRNGGPVLVSADGVYFRTLSGWEAPGMKVCAGAEGTLLLPTDKQGFVQDPAVPLAVDRAEIRALWAACFGQAPIYVAVDGTYLESVDLPLYQVSGCTMAPMRTLAAALGLDFTYDGATRTAVCTREGLTISVQAGSTWATVNGETTDWLAVPARLDGGIFYVPVRFLAEAAGMDVAWEAEGRTFRLTTPQA